MSKNIIIAGLAVALVAVSVGAGVLAQSQRTANVEVRVWEDVNDPERNFISARPEGGSWSTLGTIRLPLTDGVSSSGRFRYGDITLAVPLLGDALAPSRPTATPFRGEGKIGSTHYVAADTSSTGFTTLLATFTQNEDALLQVMCSQGSIRISIAPGKYWPDGPLGSGLEIKYQFSDAPEKSAIWAIEDVVFGGIGSVSGLRAPSHILNEMRSATTLSLQLAGQSFTFDISQMLKTPAQVNIDNCGQSGWR